MSVRRNVVWRTGEDWGFEVDCRDVEGQPIVVTGARFRMGTEDGLAVDLNDIDDSSQVYFEDSVVTVAIPKSLRDDVINDVYDYVLQADDADGVASDQQHGTVTVEHSLFPEAA